MLRNEFETRTNIRVSEEYFVKVINPLYMSNDLDKDSFCNDWKRHKMFWMENMARWEANRANENELKMRYAEDNAEALRKQRDELENTIGDLLQKIRRYEAVIDAIKQSIPSEF